MISGRGRPDGKAAGGVVSSQAEAAARRDQHHVGLVCRAQSLSSTLHDTGATEGLIPLRSETISALGANH